MFSCHSFSLIFTKVKMNIFILTHFHFSFSLFIFTSFYLSIFEYFTNLHISNCPTPPLDLFWTDFFGQFFFCAETRFFLVTVNGGTVHDHCKLQLTIVDNDIHTFILNTNHMPQRIVVEQLEIIILKETPIANTGYKFIKTDHSLVVSPTRTSMR